MISVRVGGTIIAVGFVGGLGPVDVLPMMMKAANLRAILVEIRPMFSKMNDFMDTHKLIPIIDSIFPVHAFQASLVCLAPGPFGKVVVTF